MLVLARKENERIIVGGGESGLPEIVLTVVKIDGHKVRLGIDAPREIPILRPEAINKTPARRDGEAVA